MDRQEIVKEIRRQLKEKGITTRQVSVTSKSVMYDDAITVIIKDLNVNIKTVEEIANQYESIRYDEYCGEVLEGGNIYVNVRFDYKVLDNAKQEYINKAEEIINNNQGTPYGQLVTVKENDNMVILYCPNRENGNVENISLCKKVKGEYNGEEYTSYENLERWAAYNKHVIAEALTIFKYQYGMAV